LTAPAHFLCRFAILAAMIALAPAAAMAHEVHLFAAARGKTIEGEAHWADGKPVSNASIRVLAPDGRLLGQTKTDGDGKFTFECRNRCDHRLVVNAGGGHGAEHTIEAGKLPDDLPALDELSGNGPSGHSHADSAGHSHSHNPSHAHSHGHTDGGDETDIDSLERQIIILQKDLDQFQQQLRLRDIIGGVGYIVGVVGLWSFLAGRRKAALARGDRLGGTP
jgi:nickel transport protein